MVNMFECSVRMRPKYEPFDEDIMEEHFHCVPRVGEHIYFKQDHYKMKVYEVEDVVHFVGGSADGHQVIVYVKEIEKYWDAGEDYGL
jgi:hypothetical protein